MVNKKLRVYLDNCTFNRPFDDQTHIRIRIETEAKLFLQENIKGNNIELIWSYILDIENGNNPYKEKKESINKWKKFATIDIDESEQLIHQANKLALLGANAKDALHAAAAIEGKADYFITTDDRLLKVLINIEEIIALNPVNFVGIIDGHDN